MVRDTEVGETEVARFAGHLDERVPVAVRAAHLIDDAIKFLMGRRETIFVDEDHFPYLVRVPATSR